MDSQNLAGGEYLEGVRPMNDSLNKGFCVFLIKPTHRSWNSQARRLDQGDIGCCCVRGWKDSDSRQTSQQKTYSH